MYERNSVQSARAEPHIPSGASVGEILDDSSISLSTP